MTTTLLPAPMALCPFGGAIPTGKMGTSIGASTTFQFNAAGDKLAILFLANSSTVPDIVAFVVSTVTTAGTTGAIEATLENVTTGDPSGAVTNSATGSGTISTTGQKTISGMAGTATVTAGTVYAVVLTAGAGWDRDLLIRIAVGTSEGYTTFPIFKSKDTAGSWTRVSTNNCGFNIGLANSGGTAIQLPGLMGAYDAAYQAFSSATNPDERGNRFVLTTPMTCCGVLLMLTGGSAPGANDDIKVKLLTSHTATPVEQRTITLEGESLGAEMAKIVLFSSGYACSAGTTYAVTVEALGSETQSMIRWDWASNSHLGGVLGTSFYATTRNDLGNCTDDDNSMYSIFPLFSHADDGASAGGAVGGGIVGIHGIGTGVIA